MTIDINDIKVGDIYQVVYTGNQNPPEVTKICIFCNFPIDLTTGEFTGFSEWGDLGKPGNVINNADEFTIIEKPIICEKSDMAIIRILLNGRELFGWISLYDAEVDFLHKVL